MLAAPPAKRGGRKPSPQTAANVVEDRATGYARDVVAGRIVAGPWVRLACQRHLDDLVDGPARGLWWDVAEVERALQLVGFLHLHEGDHAGKPFRPEDWQAFVIGSLFGWKMRDAEAPNAPRETWPRRFRTGYVEAAKGNGKTPVAAAVGIKGLVADGEHGAEIYTAGVTRDQAAYLFGDAANMAEASPALKKRLEIGAHNMAHLASGSYMRPVSSEGRSLDQKRVHMALIDEIHEHRTATVVNKMRAGTKGRKNALIFEITNSGYDRHSICWQHHEYSTKVLTGAIANDSWFAYVCALDEGDDWTDEKVWIKANPNLGVSITLRYLREQVAEAIGMPANENLVKRLNFCIWTEQDTRAIALETWDACADEPDEHELGVEAWGALDLASTTDITSLSLLVPTEVEIDSEDGPSTDTRLDVIQRFWVPEEGVAMRSKRDHVPYDVWVRDGVITTTPGNVTDYDRVRADIHELAEKYRIRKIAYDRWNACQLVTQLISDGFDMVPFGQGMGSMAPAFREFMRLLAGRSYRHGGNPVLRWMASNAAAEQDASGNQKPSKAKSTERIDGIVTVTMATGVWMLDTSEEEERSVYEERASFQL